MRIRWNTVTWYSKLAALLLFIALPFFGFWGGIWYEQTIYPRDIIITSPQNGATSETPNTTPSTSGIFPGRETPKEILAAAAVAFEPNQVFSAPGLPNVTFRIARILRVSGPIVVPTCGTGRYIYLPDSRGNAGSCVPEQKLALDGGVGAIAVIELEIANKSKAYVNSRFLQVFYNPETGSDLENRIAPMVPSMDGYGALPQSTRSIRIGFLVPPDQKQFQLVYGDYGKATGLPESQEIMLGKSIGGWIANFEEKSLRDIPG